MFNPFRTVRIKQQGFTLLEVLLAVVILTTGVVVIIQTLSMASYSLQENKNYWEAMNFSENQMFDLLRQRPLVDLENNKDPSATTQQFFVVQWETSDFFNSEESQSSLNNLLRKVIFHVRWGSNEKQREVQIVTGMLQPEK